MMSGAKGTAKCGHSGTAIIGQYYRCDVGCDATGKSVVPGAGDPGDEDAQQITNEVEVVDDSGCLKIKVDLFGTGRCPRCNSPDVEKFDGVYVNGIATKHCNPCGTVFV